LGKNDGTYTMKLREKTFVVFIALVYLMVQGGCATGRYEYPKPEPLLETYREQLGTIGVTTGQDFPAPQYDRPLPKNPGVLVRMGQGTVEGAEESWDWWVDLCSGEVWKKKHVEKRMVGAAIGALALPVVAYVLVGVCYILTPPVAFFGALGGTIGGAWPEAEPEYVPLTESAIRYTLERYPIQETLQSTFLKEARFRTSYAFVVVPEEGPQTSEGMAGQSVDTVLELSVNKIWWKRASDLEGDMNPPMVLALFVRARIVRGTEKTVWYDQTFVHETERRSYRQNTPWSYYFDFQEDLEKAYHKLAEQMVHKLFLHEPTNHPAKIDASAFFSETTLISQK